MRSTRTRAVVPAIMCAAILAASGTAYAQAETPISSTRCGNGLRSFGPIGPFGYPSYYVDQNLFALDHCDEPLSVDPLCGNPDFGDPLGEGLPFGPIPDIASGNFWHEQFYFLGLADMVFAGGDALLVLAVEGVWDNAAEAIIDGDQLVFSRIRVRITLPNLPSSVGTYTVTHPYGVETFNVTAADIAARAGIRAINFTDDCLHTVVGGVITPTCSVAAGDHFTNPLADLTDGTVARISHFMTWDSGAPAGYIGNPAILHTATGGSCGTNFFRVAGPGIPGGSVTTNLFSLMGRQTRFCGDGTVDTNLGEQCDPGADIAGDCCTATCTFESGTPCDDGSICTSATTCNGGTGVCGGGTSIVCNDLNPCTNDSCHPTNGCVTTNNTAACDDLNPCTTNDACSGGSCRPGAARNCNDLNVCTTDSCNPASGCVNTNNTAPCDDGNSCTTGERCSGGSCQPGGPLVCTAAGVVTTIEADVTAQSDKPTSNVGTSSQINADAGPTVKELFMRVRVQGLAGRSVTSAKLRLKVASTTNAQSVTGGRIHRITSCGWSETGVTFNNRPAIDGPVLQTLGAVALGQQVEFDVSTQIGADGVYCFAIDSASTDGVDYHSRQASATANRPALVLTTACPACGGPAAVCGDNQVNQASEQCDGTASTACPGQCRADCTCPAPATQPAGTILADVTVDSSVPGINLGTRTQLGVDAGGQAVKRTFVRVQVSNVGSRTVSSALLNLQVSTTTNAESPVSGGMIHRITDCGWGETTTTWNNQPVIDGSVLSTLGPVAQGQNVSFDVTAAIPGDGTYCFAIDSATTEGTDYQSREASAGRPTLTVVVAP